MIYFSSAQVSPDNIDHAQYLALQAFKQSLNDRSLLEKCQDSNDFRVKLTRQLAQKIITSFPGEADPRSTLHASPQQPALPALSPAATKLIVEASMDRQGVVMNMTTLDGVHVQTNGTNFAERDNSRSGALWRGAVAELARNGLLEDRAGKGEVYYITDEGYRAAERLQER